MTRLFRSKSCGLVGVTEFDSAPAAPTPSFFHHRRGSSGAVRRHDDEEDYDEDCSPTAISTPFISPASRYNNDGGFAGRTDRSGSSSGGNQFAILDVVVTALRRSLISCSVVEREDVSSSSASLDISWPTEVKHVSHVTFDRFNGFLGLPRELEPELPRKVPSASANVFGVSAESMQCSYDDRGNSVPTILLMMQRRLYVEGGLKAEGIFRINAENSQEEYVRSQLNKGVVPRTIDYHCLAGLIKAWFRELPSGVLDCLTPEQVMHCNTEDDCTHLVKMLPPTESALLDWAINLMADVVEHEQYNKMNARNVAMVFAPNMTQMADPLTALIHAVQVMNLLKTLITRTIRERSAKAATEQSSSSQPDPLDSGLTSNILGSNSTSAEDDQGSDSISVSSPTMCEMRTLEEEDGCNEVYKENDQQHRSLSRGMGRLCRHPIFQFNKPVTSGSKKMGDVGFVNSRGGGREAAWA